MRDSGVLDLETEVVDVIGFGKENGSRGRMFRSEGFSRVLVRLTFLGL